MQCEDNQKLIEYYKNAMTNIKSNPDSAVNYARKAAECVLKSIISGSGKSFNSHATLENLLEQIKKSKINSNPKIELAVRTIQLYANYGAHDQGYQLENNGGIIRQHEDLASDDISACMCALTQLMKKYLQKSLEDEVFSIDSISKEQDFVDKYTLKLGTSNLTVPDCIMQGWNCESVFSKYNIDVLKIARKWNNQILDELQEGTLDMAIYNKQSTLEYIAKNPNAEIQIIRDVCSSMGGRNFYILASKKGKWADMTLKQFKEALGNGVIIAVSKNSDMERNLLYILEMTMDELKQRGVMLFDYHSDQGLGIFDMSPDVLVIGGQDLRFLAEKVGGYIEVVTYENLPLDKREFFDKNSVNSIIIGKNFSKRYPKNVLDNIINQLMVNFYASNISEESKKAIRDKLRPQVKQICKDDSVADYIINSQAENPARHCRAWDECRW